MASTHKYHNLQPQLTSSEQPVTRMLDTWNEWRAKESGTDSAEEAVKVCPPDVLTDYNQGRGTLNNTREELIGLSWTSRQLGLHCTDNNKAPSAHLQWRAAISRNTHLRFHTDIRTMLILLFHTLCLCAYDCNTEITQKVMPKHLRVTQKQHVGIMKYECSLCCLKT